MGECRPNFHYFELPILIIRNILLTLSQNHQQPENGRSRCLGFGPYLFLFCDVLSISRPNAPHTFRTYFTHGAHESVAETPPSPCHQSSMFWQIPGGQLAIPEACRISGGLLGLICSFSSLALEALLNRLGVHIAALGGEFWTFWSEHQFYMGPRRPLRMKNRKH